MISPWHVLCWLDAFQSQELEPVVHEQYLYDEIKRRDTDSFNRTQKLAASRLCYLNLIWPSHVWCLYCFLMVILLCQTLLPEWNLQNYYNRGYLHKNKCTAYKLKLVYLRSKNHSSQSLLLPEPIMYWGRKLAQLPNTSDMYFSTPTWPASAFTVSCKVENLLDKANSCYTGKAIILPLQHVEAHQLACRFQHCW